MAPDGTSIDLLAREFYAGDPHTTYTWLRQHDPVHRDEANGLWGIARYDDIIEVEKNKALFINSGQDDNGYRPLISADKSIIGLDDPEHTERRMLVARRFTPRAVGKWEDEVRASVRALLDAVDADGRVEVIADLAAPLPAMMIGKLLGYPAEMWPKLQEWSERTIQLGGGPPYFDPDGVDAVFEFTAACMEVYEEHKVCPMDDVMGAWVEAERTGLKSGKPFDLDPILSDCLLLLDGGAETTRTVIGRTLMNLATHPDQWAALRDGADLTVATEEFIRYVTPIHNMCRAATAATELGGKEIAEGDQLVLLYSSANRDEAVFSDGQSFDVTRDPNPHIAFGFGTHFCLGAALARLEIRVFFEEFVARFAALDLVADPAPVEMPNAFVYGLKSAHLQLTPA